MTKQDKIDWLSENIAKPECILSFQICLSEFDDAFIDRIYDKVKGVLNAEKNI